MLRKIFMAAAMLTFSSYHVQAQNGLDLENVLYLDLEVGRVSILLRPDLAPNTVARVKELARSGFYDGLTFHRVIEGFMAQGGDPAGNGTGGSGQKLDAEFTRTPHLRGTVSMARAADDENSADSQFFIVFNRIPQLDNDYTVFGRVFGGMEFVDQINRGEPPLEPTKIVKIQVAADVKE